MFNRKSFSFKVFVALALVMLVVGSLVAPAPAFADGCPAWGVQPLTMDQWGTCHGKWSEPVLGGVPELYYAEFWNDQVGGVRYAPSGSVFWVNELSLKRGSPPDASLIDTPDVPNSVIPCPTFAGLATQKTEPNSTDCKLAKMSSRVTGTVAAGWSFEFWDDDQRKVRIAQAGETIKADEGTYHLVDANVALGQTGNVSQPQQPVTTTTTSTGACPMFAGGQSVQDGAHCKWHSPDGTPKTDKVPGGFRADCWLTALGAARYGIPSGTEVQSTVECTFKRA